jgi:hypothetical protein
VLQTFDLRLTKSMSLDEMIGTIIKAEYELMKAVKAADPFI